MMRVLIAYILFISCCHGILTNAPLDLSACRSATATASPCCMYPTDYAKCASTIGILCSDLPGNPDLCKPSEALVFPTGATAGDGGEILPTVCKTSVEDIVPPMTASWNYYTFKHIWGCCPCPPGYTLISSEPTDCNDITHNGISCYGCNGVSEVFSLSTGTPICVACSSILPTPTGCAGNGKTLPKGCPKQCGTPPQASGVSSCCKPTNSPAVGKCGLDSVGEAFIKQEEGWCSEYYADTNGFKTIGWGHNCDGNKGTCNGITTPIDACKADNLFWDDTKVPMHWIGKMPNANLLTQNQLNALLSLVYNCGGKDVVSTGNLYKDMAAGALDKICTGILSACKNSAGVVQNPARRKAESALCAQPPATAMKCKF